MSKRVLIVDDNAFMRMTLERDLTGNGYEVVGQAIDGGDAVEKYKQLQPDIVTLDLVMPVLDGIEVVRRIRAFDPGANIVMCSSMGQDKLIAEAIVAGAKDFIVKPIDKQRLLDALEKLTG